MDNFLCTREHWHFLSTSCILVYVNKINYFIFGHRQFLVLMGSSSTSKKYNLKILNIIFLINWDLQIINWKSGRKTTIKITINFHFNLEQINEDVSLNLWWLIIHLFLNQMNDTKFRMEVQAITSKKPCAI